MTWHRSIQRRLSLCLIASLMLPAGAMASALKPTASSKSVADRQNGQGPNQPIDQKEVDQQGVGATPPATAAPPQASMPQTAPQSPAQSSQAPTQTPTPLGTAAAPDTRMDGVAASTPSGAAIAPAKQRRVRKFSIRTALVVGAAVAIGTIVGASAATSKRP